MAAHHHSMANQGGEYLGMREPPTQRARLHQQIPTAPRIKLAKVEQREYSSEMPQFAEPKKKQPKVLMQRDDLGNIIYPI